MAPEPQSSIVMAITAADDCTQNVSTPPKSRNTSVVQKESGSNDWKNDSTDGLCPRSISLPVMRSVVSPKSSNPKPKRKSPM